MRLSELRGQTRQTGQYEEQQSQTLETGTVRNAFSYQRPIDAALGGKPVKIIACGDVTGMSQANQFVDENGHIDWASSDDFTVTDWSLLPHTQQQRDKLAQQSSQNLTRR